MQRKPICDFLLVFYCNYMPIFSRVRDTTIYWSKICFGWVIHPVLVWSYSKGVSLGFKVWKLVSRTGILMSGFINSGLTQGQPASGQTITRCRHRVKSKIVLSTFPSPVPAGPELARAFVVWWFPIGWQWCHVPPGLQHLSGTDDTHAYNLL